MFTHTVDLFVHGLDLSDVSSHDIINMIWLKF